MTRRNATHDGGGPIWDRLERLLVTMLGKLPVTFAEAANVYAQSGDRPLAPNELDALVAAVIRRRALQGVAVGICREHCLVFTADTWSDLPSELVQTDVVYEGTSYVTGFDSASIDVRRLDLERLTNLPLPVISSEQPVVYDIFPDYAELGDWYDRVECQRIAGWNIAGDRRGWIDQQLVAVVRAPWPWDDTDEEAWEGWSNN